MNLKIIRLLFIFYTSDSVFATPVIQTLLPNGGLFPLECGENDSILQYKEELVRNYGEKPERVTNIERYPFAYLPLIRRDEIISQHLQWDIQANHPIEILEQSTDNRIFTCAGIESYSAVSPISVYFSAGQVKSHNESFTQPTLVTPNYSYSYRFKDTVFSWESHHSLTNIREEDALIPTELLDAILRSNFELFFLQKQISDEELHAVYLNILHGSLDHTIAKASTSNFSNLSTLLLVLLVFCFFIKKYLRGSQTKPISLEVYKLHSGKKTSRFIRRYHCPQT